MNKFMFPYHLVSVSPWPLLSSFSVIILMIGSLKFLNMGGFNLLFLGFLVFLLVLGQWWRDVIRESTFQGGHTKEVLEGLRLGMLLFILSEVMFFLSFFWTYFSMFLSPSIEIGSIWYPSGIEVFNPYNIPLLNTLILLSSGVSITWSHYLILNDEKKKDVLLSVGLTIVLGILFTLFQYLEYSESYFSMSDSSYGSIFFLITGFHGFHVIMGMLFILITFFRVKSFHYSSFHHFGFEAASWYWHFVDVVWLFLYIFVYWLSY